MISELFLIKSTVLETILGFDLSVDLLKSLSDIEETDSFLSLSDTRMYICPFSVIFNSLPNLAPGK